jgi:amino acid adenylation domain-containing protein
MSPSAPDNPFVEFPKAEIEQSIPDRFGQQVRRHGQRVAVDAAGLTLSYAALNEAANRLAQTLLAQLGERQEPVAFLLAHGPRPIVAILGILKAGKCYVPLDPAWPEARIARILEDAEARRIVTDREHLLLAKKLATKTRRLVDLEAIPRRTSAEDPGLRLGPDAMASILYTSGSTGQPKGVVQTHRNVLHNVMKYTNGLHISAADRLSLLPRSSYGASASDIFGALLNGAALLPFDLREQGPERLAAWLIDREVTIYHSVPTVFRRLVASLTPQTRFPKLRLIKLGGEPVTRRDVQSYQEHFAPGCILHVGYGATETNILRQYFLRTDTPIPGDLVPVGYAVQDTEIVLLDPSGSEVALGGPGEIAVRSAYLPPGYWRREDLTAATFRPVPGGRSLRIYRTGDMGRMLADGCLLCLGRKDSQVKVRGYRVDLAEIEAALAAFEDVRQACVVARQCPDEETRLVAYVVAATGRTPGAATLRHSLAGILPDFMLPASIVLRRDLPETASGKVDRQALAKLPWHAASPQAACPAPRTSLEELLVAMWCEALGLDRLGIRDNFFEIGGHSLLAAQLFTQIEKVLGVRLPVPTLLQAPTVERLASVIGHGRPPRAIASLVPMQPAGSRPPFFCVHGADGHVLKFHMLAKLLGPDQPFYGLQGRGIDGTVLPRTSIQAMATAYLREIRALQPDGPYFLGGYSLGGGSIPPL